MKRLLAMTAGVVVVLAAASPAAAAGPALWVLSDADSTVYLFGTVHVLKPDTPWRTPGVDKALAEARDLWIEVEADDPAVMQPLLQKYGYDPARPLSGKLTPEQRARLDATTKAIGASSAALEPMRPWLAGVTLSVVPMLKAGYDPASGVESRLKAAAKAVGKPIRTLESPEEQIRFFADLPQPVEVEILLSALDEAAEPAAILDQMVAAWSVGDVAALDRLMTAEMKADYPELYKVLLVDRNRAWAERIDTLMDGSGVTFIAVGAGHLTGDDSVQAFLAKRGIEAQRLAD